MDDFYRELEQYTIALIDESNSLGELKRAADGLYSFFLRIAQVQDDYQSRENYYLLNGKAIGTYWAGICVTEFMRTGTFLRGIHQAIKDAQKKFTEGPIHILYAGCGPFGTLLVPLTTIFRSDEIKITFIDINQYSLNYLKKIIAALDIGDYVEGIIQGDAVEYAEDRDIPVHMIVTETMQNALKKEPQVAITCHLVPLLTEGGILIPENITISAALINHDKEKECLMEAASDCSFIYPLGTIFQLNKDNLKAMDYGHNGFQEAFIELPEKFDAGYKSFSLLTEIQVYKQEKLTYNQCSLTLPHRLMSIDWQHNHIKQVGLQYISNEKPGFVYRCIENEKNTADITLEPIAPGHKELIYNIFKDIHPELTNMKGLAGEQLEGIIKLQFEMEQKQLMELYPFAERRLIVLDGTPAGYVYTDTGNDIRIIEIGLFEKYRNNGIGSKIVRDLISKANDLGKSITLQVLWFNDAAYRFYKRMGFAFVHNNGVAYEMKYVSNNDKAYNNRYFI